MQAMLLALLMAAPSYSPVCVPSKDPRVQECAVKTTTEVVFLHCLTTESGKTCFKK